MKNAGKLKSGINLKIIDLAALFSIYLIFFLTTPKYYYKFNLQALIHFIMILCVSSYFFLKNLNHQGYYHRFRIISIARDVKILIKGLCAQFIVFMFLLFLSKNLFLAPRRVTFSFISTAFILVIFRLYILSEIMKLRKSGDDVSNIVLIGQPGDTKIIETKILSYIKYGLRLVKIFDVSELEKKFDSVKEFLIQNNVKEIIMTNQASYLDIYKRLAGDLKKNGIISYFVPDSYNIITSVSVPYKISNLTFLKIIDTPLTGIKFLLKRLMDISLSLILLISLAPFLLIIMLFIKIDSPGPVFFKQKRVGRKGKLFVFYKFRTMCADAEKKLDGLKKFNEADGPIFKIRKDPRVTAFGSFLRKFSIDELPQLYNVLKGEMSLIGPRPPIPSEVEKYEEWHKRRLSVMPGLTGLWQVRGRSDLSFTEMVKLDIYYIEQWTLGLDLYIFLKTITTVITARGSY
ncbi:sugar transferase [Candidatus Dependentiae bacterium]|nr:sugar transferase [Candidatus Dependentiae bacterium]